MVRPLDDADVRDDAALGLLPEPAPGPCQEIWSFTRRGPMHGGEPIYNASRSAITESTNSWYLATMSANSAHISPSASMAVNARSADSQVML